MSDDMDWSQVSDDDCKNALRRCYAELLDQLEWKDVLSALYADFLISDRAKEEIEAKHTRSDACSNLLEKVKQRGKSAFVAFAKQLVVTKQCHLYNLLMNKLRELAPKAFANGASPECAAARHAGTEEANRSSTPGGSAHLQSSAGRSQGAEKPLLAALEAAMPSQQSQPPKLPQHSQPPQQMYVAVQLLMSMRNTHVEVQAVLGSDEQALRSWQRAWKDEEPDQPDMPPPKLVTRSDDGSMSIVARLTNTDEDSKTVYHHGSRGTSPRPLPGYADWLCHAWLFSLHDTPAADLRQFTLHLHEALGHSAVTVGHEICEAFKIQEYRGSCFIRQLGFSPSNHRRISPSVSPENFARSTTSSGVVTTRSMRRVTEISRSVGTIYKHGKWIGTGICVGSQDFKWLLTCHHVYVEIKKALADGEVYLSFEDFLLDNANTMPFVLTGCAAENRELDYAVLTVSNSDKMPPPVSCCSKKFEEHTEGRVSGVYLTIVGYCEAVRTVDMAADWLRPTRKYIDLVKRAVADEFPQFMKHLHEYDDLAKSATITLFYNVARHKHGSSGSAVLFCEADVVKLVALHRCGLPAFYYKNKEVECKLPMRYTMEAGTRMSAIHEDLSNKDEDICRKIFA